MELSTIINVKDTMSKVNPASIATKVTIDPPANRNPDGVSLAGRRIVARFYVLTGHEMITKVERTRAITSQTQEKQHPLIMPLMFTVVSWLPVPLV